MQGPEGQVPAAKALRAGTSQVDGQPQPVLTVTGSPPQNKSGCFLWGQCLQVPVGSSLWPLSSPLVEDSQGGGGQTVQAPQSQESSMRAEMQGQDLSAWTLCVALARPRTGVRLHGGPWGAQAWVRTGAGT